MRHRGRPFQVERNDCMLSATLDARMRCGGFSYVKSSYSGVQRRAGSRITSVADKRMRGARLHARRALCGGWSIMVEIEDVPVQVLYGELPQSPRLGFQRLHDVRA